VINEHLVGYNQKDDPAGYKHAVCDAVHDSVNFLAGKKSLHLRTIIMAQILMRMQHVMTLLLRLSCLHRKQQLSVQVRCNYALLIFVQIEITNEVSYLKENKRGKEI